MVRNIANRQQNYARRLLLAIAVVALVALKIDLASSSDVQPPNATIPAAAINKTIIATTTIKTPAVAAATIPTTTTTATSNVNTSTTPVPTIAPTSSPVPITRHPLLAGGAEKKVSQARENGGENSKHTIHQHFEQHRNLIESRLFVNKPTMAPTVQDFAADSPEARVSDATSQFGLRFLSNLADMRDNVVISPLSLQNLLNMVLLGATDNSATQLELARILGYETTNLFSANSSTSDRLKPHEAMRSVFQSILAATHLSVQTDQNLLNTNAGALVPPPLPSATKPGSKVAAHLQTSVRENEEPLSGQVNFTLANLVLTNKDLIELKADYEKDLKTYYNVNVEQFSKPPTTNATADVVKKPPILPLHERVNNWVKNKTQNQIEKLANEGDLNADDIMMVLLNAAHFKGRWLHTFNTKATFERSFYNFGSDKEATEVKFMRQKATFGFADFTTNSLNRNNNDEFLASLESKTKSTEDLETLLTEDITSNAGNKTDMAELMAGNAATSSTDGSAPVTQQPAPHMELSKEETRRLELTNKLNCSALLLPFSLNDGQELSMVILLPAERNGLPKLEANLDSAALNEIYRSLSEQEVQVELPKFSFEASIDAKATLLKMGLSSIFNQKANLDRMYTTKGGLSDSGRVDKVIHKAKITVDESGAEAAAASMAVIVLRNMITRLPTPHVIVDRPFLFIIRHNRSNMPLFMGRVSKL